VILRATGSEPRPTPTPPPTPVIAAAVPVIPEWTLPPRSIERTGYRDGRRHPLTVVRLGPKNVEVELRTAEAFLAMRAAAGRVGIELGLVSGFRTGEQQRVLYRNGRK